MVQTEAYDNGTLSGLKVEDMLLIKIIAIRSVRKKYRIND